MPSLQKPPAKRRKTQSGGGSRPNAETSPAVAAEQSDSDFEATRVNDKGPALPLEAHEIGPWIDCVRREGGSRGNAGLKHAMVEFFKLRGALRPSEGLQLVPANFTCGGNGKWILHVKDNGYKKSATGKLVPRSLPLDDSACGMLDTLFSEEGLVVTEQTMQWTRGSGLPCFPGGAPGRVSDVPITIQAHNQALSKAAAAFANEREDEALHHLSGHSMRRTAVHLFESKKIPYSVGMKFTGHKSVEVYMRYANQPSIRTLTAVARDVFTSATPSWGGTRSQATETGCRANDGK